MRTDEDPQRAVLRETVALHAAQPATPEAALQARRLLVDTLGCALAGRHADEVRRLEAALAACEPGDFSFPGGPAMGVQAAAQVLAMAATWDEACEGHALAHGRPGVPLVAALLPLALRRGAGLGEFIEAFVLGYEVGARCGAWLRIRPGMHVDANWPALGVAAGVARLLGLAPEGIVQAIDIAACQLATSLYLPVQQGRTARNTYLGHSASSGLQAAFASAAGIDAPAGALAHYALTHSAASAQPLPDAQTLLLRDAYLKPFAAVRHVHYGATAARRIREQLGRETRGIHRIALKVYDEAIVYCGNRAPHTPIQAQFSLSFGIAAMLRFGDVDPSVYAAPRFDDPELRRLEALVVLETDADLTARKQRGATLSVAHAGGGFEESVGTIAGDAAYPLDRAALTAKFAHYATLDAAHGVVGPKAAHFCDSVLDAPAGTPLGALWQQLAG
ncbi:MULTISPECIES: MmgE/PrpD family protein [Variovorax]|jgi:2-methylcitrate dehydratase PrpD|uniref:MmgE/PrpD family protein n=1 Tax=Variovorax TaxID=34072 RepID=UPI00086ECD2F|nr:MULTISPECIES: MmgE/PrpD family protein [Variovorax]MBN8752823.1 MmgE/PrpD family protein [Variovorax sp.]ODU16894.1 MAG: MmgE/PrpD family protein [Variovorax sp. SCN 67-85]ODV23513.1 MAG: MmgE/PrpD family protein [Variovorax sp. SCN 67-20]OJZ15231.1 MAG: MmgE/PrpD family protein [Variovorax sp. 67-131]UKI07962.1 MmgE/PrpD family protein [Variovorax paradoxus]